MSNLNVKAMKKIAVILVCMIAFVGFSNAQTRTAVKTADLQKAIVDNINKNFSGYIIQNAFKVEKGTATTFEVNVAKGTDKMQLIYDKEGKFLSKHQPTIAKSEASKTSNKKNKTKTK